MTVLWSIVVPVKRIAAAKTRLAPVAGSRRHELARAFAGDTVEAAHRSAGVEQVIVVTDDHEVAEMVRAFGALVVPDTPNAGLNPALEYGASVARAASRGGAVAALSADLPALRSDELDAALAIAATHERCFVADASGDGTTLLTARPGVPLRPAFGPHSARRHRSDGAYEITADNLDSMRLDVDTEADLRLAAAMGLGPRSARVAAAILGSARGV